MTFERGTHSLETTRSDDTEASGYLSGAVAPRATERVQLTRGILFATDTNALRLDETGPRTLNAAESVYLPEVLDETRRQLDSRRNTARLARYDALTDPLTLFLFNKIVEADGIHLSVLNGLLANSKGWARVVKLQQAEVIELVGEYLEVTDMGRLAYSDVISLLNI